MLDIFLAGFCTLFAVVKQLYVKDKTTKQFKEVMPMR